MLPQEERDTLLKTLQDTIQENVPSALEEAVSESVTAYRVSNGSEPEVFCLLEVHEDRLEIGFPRCPGVVRSDGRFESVDESEACRLRIRKRTDIPGELLNAAIKAAAGLS